MARTIVALATLLASSLATADAPKRPPLKLDVQLSERVRPAERKVPAQAAPSLGADKIMAIEVLTSPIHAEQEAILIKLIAATPDSAADEKAELYFRLGELYAKQQRLARLQSAEAEIKGDTKAAQAAAAKATGYLVNAAKAYKALTENTAFQNFVQMDLALFVYAYTLQSGKYLTEARAIYDKLLKNYPSSKYVAEAHLAFAEFYWDSGKLDDAEDRYKLVLKFPKSNAYWYAMYKIGWIQHNRSRFDEALETFYQVVRATASDPKRDVLHRNAKKDFVRSFAEVGRADKALVAFKRVDSRGAFDMLETLAGFYMEQGKSDKAIYTYRELMKQAPKHANVCQWQYEVAHAMMTLPGATSSDRVREIADLNQLYSALSRRKSLPAVQAGECRENAAAMSGELARAYHSEWSRTLSVESYAAANKLYTTYLTTFPDAQDAPKTRFHAADLLWSRAEREKDARLKTRLWEETAVAFGDVVREGKTEAAQLNEAAYASVLAWLAAHESDPRPVPPTAEVAKGDGRKADETPAQPRPIPQREQNMLAAFDLYLTRTKSPPEKELVQMKFLKANVLRRFDHLAGAVPLFKEIMTKYPQHDAAQDAALLLVDIYIRQSNEPALLALADQLLTTKKLLADLPELEKKLQSIKAVALRKRVEKIEAEARKTKDFALFVQCGQGYLDIYNRNPEDEKGDEVLYNAGVCFEEGRSLDAAMRMYHTMQRYYPKSKITARATARLGKTYADMAFYDDAARTLEHYAKTYAGEKDAFDAMSDAVFYFKGVGNDVKAIEDTRYFVKMFGAKKPTEAAEATFSLTSIFEKRRDTDGLIKHLREYVRVHGSRAGTAKLVVAHAKIGQALLEQSCPVKLVDGACIKVTRERAVAVRGVNRSKTQCGPDSKIKLTVVTRDARKVRDAREAFTAAVREYAKVPAASPEYGLARHHASQAKLGEATVELEGYYAVTFPTNLDFNPKAPAIAKRSLARFDAYLTGKEAAGKRVADKYAAVLELKDSASSIAAAARLAQINHHLADALFTAEIPKDVRTGPFAEEASDAFCDKLLDAVNPLADRAVEAYGMCLSKSTELGWFSEWSQLCERELGQIKPEKFPTASERRSDPDRVAVVTALEPPPKAD